MNSTLVVGLAAELKEAHVVGAPLARLARLQQLLGCHGDSLASGTRDQQRSHGAAIVARRQQFSKDVEPHLRLVRLVVEERTPGYGESRRFVIEPLSGKAVGELWRVGGNILQQEAPAVAMQDILVALGDVQGLREVGPVPRRLGSKHKGVARIYRLFRLYKCYNEIMMLLREEDPGHVPTNQMSQSNQPKAKKVII